MLKNLPLIVLSVSLSFAFCEAAIRVYYRDLTTTHDNRSYFALRWRRQVRLNTAGYRDRDYPAEKAAGVYRLAIAGDSFTFGQGIPEDARISNLLGQRLHVPGRSVEVLNFGRPGNSIVDEVKALERDILPTHPDFVLLQWYINDHEFELDELVAQSAPPAQRPPSFLNTAKQFMLNNLAMYYFAANAVHQARAANGVTYEREIFERVGDERSAEWQANDRALRHFFEVCDREHVRAGMFLVPDLSPLGDAPYPYRYLHDRVLGICRDDGRPCLDMLPVFEPHLHRRESAEPLWVNRFDTHMSPRANLMAATAIQSFFGPVLVK